MRKMAYTCGLFLVGLFVLLTVEVLAQGTDGATMTTDLYYDTNVVANQAFWSMLVIWGLKQLQRMPIVGAVIGQQWWIKRGLAVVASLLVSLGITYTYGYQAEVSGGQLTIVFTGLSLAAVFVKVKLWVLTFGMQQAGFKFTAAK